MMLPVYVLSIPRHENRIWALFGHLQTIGFPIVDNPNLVKVYNGYDTQDYVNRLDILQETARQGYQRHQEYLDSMNPEKLREVESFTDCVNLGMLNILRKVETGNKPVLVIEDDAYFVGVDYEELMRRWRQLELCVGCNNINVAMLSVKRPDFDELKSNVRLQSVGDFWWAGVCVPGQTANIYTPHGAARILKKPVYPNIERWLYDEQLEGVYSTKRELVDLHFFSNFDSPHAHARDTDFWNTVMQGEQL